MRKANLISTLSQEVAILKEERQRFIEEVSNNKSLKNYRLITWREHSAKSNG
jgi:hypothetical protein